jgi:hypothetical protein
LDFTCLRIQEYAVEPVWPSGVRVIAPRKGCNILARDESRDQDLVIGEAKRIRSEMESPRFLLGRKASEADSVQVHRPGGANRTGGFTLSFMAKAEG